MTPKIAYYEVPLPINAPWTTADVILYLRMEKLSQAPKLISRWVRQGRLRSMGKRGHAHLFLKSDVDAFIKLNK